MLRAAATRPRGLRAARACTWDPSQLTSNPTPSLSRRGRPLGPSFPAAGLAPLRSPAAPVALAAPAAAAAPAKRAAAKKCAGARKRTPQPGKFPRSNLYQNPAKPRQRPSKKCGGVELATDPEPTGADRATARAPRASACPLGRARAEGGGGGGGEKEGALGGGRRDGRRRSAVVSGARRRTRGGGGSARPRVWVARARQRGCTQAARLGLCRRHRRQRRRQHRRSCSRAAAASAG